MGNLREFMLKKGNTKRSSPPAGAKGNAHELITLSHKPLLLLLQLLLQRTHHLAVVAQIVAQGVVAIPVDKHI